MTAPAIGKIRLEEIRSYVDACNVFEYDELTYDQAIIVDLWTLYTRASHDRAITKARARDLLVRIRRIEHSYAASFADDDQPEDADTVTMSEEDLEKLETYLRARRVLPE